MAGFGQPACGIMLTVIDFTSIFLCAKEIVPKTWETCTLINKIVFFLSFTVIRMIGTPFLWYWCGFEMLAGWEVRTGWQSFCAMCVLIVGSVLLFLFVFWYYIIVKILCKIIRGEK